MAIATFVHQAGGGSGSKPFSGSVMRTTAIHGAHTTTQFMKARICVGPLWSSKGFTHLFCRPPAGTHERGRKMAGKQLPMASPPPPAAPKRRLPDWFRTSLPSGEQQVAFNSTKAAVKDNKLHRLRRSTLPQHPRMLGQRRRHVHGRRSECGGCRFCAVGTIKRPPPLDPEEPQHLAEAVASMNLRHAVITVVNRDDLPTAEQTATNNASMPSPNQSESPRVALL